MPIGADFIPNILKLANRVDKIPCFEGFTYGKVRRSARLKQQHDIAAAEQEPTKLIAVVQLCVEAYAVRQNYRANLLYAYSNHGN